MSKLYDITERYNNIMELIENPEIDFDTIAFAINEIQEEFSEKADNIARLIKELTLTAAMIKEEETRLSNRRKSFEKRAVNLKTYLEDNMKLTNQTKLKTAYFSFNIQNNPPSVEVLDDKMIPEEFKIREEVVNIDKKEILRRLKNEETIPGVNMKVTSGLRIR